MCPTVLVTTIKVSVAQLGLPGVATRQPTATVTACDPVHLESYIGLHDTAKYIQIYCPVAAYAPYLRDTHSACTALTSRHKESLQQPDSALT